MKKRKGSKLNTKLLAVFFVAIFLISLVSSFVFFRLLDTLKREARVVNSEQFSSAVGRLDTELSKLIGIYSALYRQQPFDSFENPDPNLSDVIQMNTEAMRLLAGVPHTRSWAVFLTDSGYVLNQKNIFELEEYAHSMPWGPEYTAEFWQNAMQQRFSKQLFPKTEPFLLSRGNDNIYYPETIPFAMKPYWKNNLMVVMFLDIEALRTATGCDWEVGFYLFDQ